MPNTDKTHDDRPEPDDYAGQSLPSWPAASEAARYFAAMCGINVSKALGHDILTTRQELIALMWGELTDQINGHFEVCGDEEVMLHRDAPIVISIAEQIGITYDELPSPAYTLNVTREKVEQEIKLPGKDQAVTRTLLWPPASTDEDTGVIYRLMLHGERLRSVAMYYDPGDCRWAVKIRSAQGEFGITRDSRCAADACARAHADMFRTSEITRLLSDDPTLFYPDAVAMVQVVRVEVPATELI